MHQFNSAIYAAVSKRLHVSPTRCNHCRTCHHTILLACQLKDRN